MRIRYQAQCEECGWYQGPIWFKRRAERRATAHFDDHELAFLEPSF